MAQLEPPSEELTKSNVYRIGELAELTGATTRTLRYYEELGLLKPIRNTSGQRLYNEAALSRLNFINELKSGGFSLQEVKTFFESWQNNDTGAAASEQTLGLVQQKLTEISELQERINKLNNELKAMIQFLAACRTCDDQPSFENCGDCTKHPSEPTPKLIMNLLRDKSNELNLEKRDT